jgi:hypothetical protein
MAVWKDRRLRPQRSQEALKPGNQSKTPNQVVALRSRPKHGYSATKYDAWVVKSPKTLRRQFRHSYDVKKVRNS